MENSDVFSHFSWSWRFLQVKIEKNLKLPHGTRHFWGLPRGCLVTKPDFFDSCSVGIEETNKVSPQTFPSDRPLAGHARSCETCRKYPTNRDLGTFYALTRPHVTSCRAGPGWNFFTIPSPLGAWLKNLRVGRPFNHFGWSWRFLKA